MVELLLKKSWDQWRGRRDWGLERPPINVRYYLSYDGAEKTTGGFKPSPITDSSNNEFESINKNPEQIKKPHWSKNERRFKFLLEKKRFRCNDRLS